MLVRAIKTYWKSLASLKEQSSRKYLENQLIMSLPNMNVEPDITPKENQQLLIKAILKPLFKEYGYKTRGQTWWKEKDEFYIIIDLQNFSWNTKDDVNFCFNIGIATNTSVTDPLNPSYNDRNVSVREVIYLPEHGKASIHRNHSGYLLTKSTSVDAFSAELLYDFQNWILPPLERLQTLDDCLGLYGNLPFWGDQLRMAIRNYQKE